MCFMLLIPVCRNLLYPDWVHVAIVACGDRQPETAVAVKTILLTATDSVFIHIFTEDDLRSNFQNEVRYITDLVVYNFFDWLRSCVLDGHLCNVTYMHVQNIMHIVFVK